MESKEQKSMIMVYEHYYKCSNKRCDSVYHTYNFRGKTFECRDCGTTSAIPREVNRKDK